MSEAKRYEGGCHCGKVRYEVTADISQSIQCNCSHCAIKAMILTFVPRDRFRLISGEDALSEYRFNKHVIEHKFCKFCGVESFAQGVGPDGKPMSCINLRCLDGVDVGALRPMPYDGRSV